MLFQEKWIQKQAGVVIFISDFKTKLVRRDKEGHFIMIKGTIHQDDITHVNIYAPNIDTSHLMKNTPLDIESQVDTRTIIVCDFNR
jgi:hypothetical protein